MIAELQKARGLAVDAVFFFHTADRAKWGTAHTPKPDRDNLDKLVLDTLRAAGALAGRDDAHVADGRLTKLWSIQAGAVIIVRPFGGEPWTLAQMRGEDDEPEPAIPAIDTGKGRPDWL